MNKAALVVVLSLSIIVIQLEANGAPGTPIKGKVANATGYHAVLIDGRGKVSLSKLSETGAFSFRAKTVRGSTLVLIDESGRAFGPVVLSSSKGKLKAYLGFSGKLPEGVKKINLGTISLRTGYAQPSRKILSSLVSKSGALVANTDSDGNPVGAASGGIAEVSRLGMPRKRIKIEEGEGLSTPGSDTDSDGIIDALDPDVDGDGVVNIADTDFAGNDDATFSSLVVDFNQTLNANIGSVADDDIDAVIGGENVFAIGFWSSLPPDSEITGGHVICADSNLYCNRTSGTAVYGGLSESDQSLIGQLWRTLNADGSGYPNIEYLSLSGGNAVAASIQPRLGTSAVRPGDAYLVEYTGADGRVVESKLLLLSPYMVTVPALKSYTIGSTETVLDYSNIETQPGSQSSPIVTDSDGKLTVTFWRPQRLLYRTETPASESDRYRDMGYLKYGFVFEGVSRQFTCAGLHTNIASDLVEASDPLGTDGSPYADQGANLFPLVDSAGDATPTPTRTLSVTIDLRQCLARASQSVGDYRLRIIASGEELSGGSNAASQMFNVRVQ